MVSYNRHFIFAGGLGNQMFEYAYILALRERGFKVKIDISFYDYFQMHNGYELDKVFNIKEPLTNKKGLHLLWLRFLDKVKPSLLYTGDDGSYQPEAIEHPKKYIRGWWQNEKYFQHIAPKVREIFTFQHIDENNNIALEMQSCNSVSLHIRRGDYASFGVTLMGEDYYKKAINTINENVKNPFYYIFSDDKEEAERIAKLMNIPYKIISNNIGADSYKDMYLMSQCKHNIIANSSFSWWGAWLNKNNQKIVISPIEWIAGDKKHHPQLDKWIKL